MKEYFTTKEVCKLLDISRVTLHKYIKDGEIKPACKVKGRNMFLKDDLLKSDWFKGLKGYLLYLGTYDMLEELEENK